MWKRCVLLLLGVGCGGSNGEIDLVLENRTSSGIVVQESNACGAGHVQILDDAGRALSWACGGGTMQVSGDAEAADFAPMVCVNGVRTIATNKFFGVHWDGYFLDGEDCKGTGESFQARFCFGTTFSTQTNSFGMSEQIVDDVRCETMPFELGVDTEARYVVE